jgi:hypothetical protein
MTTSNWPAKGRSRSAATAQARKPGVYEQRPADPQFSSSSGRAVVRWRYDGADGHVRGVDIIRVRNDPLAESLAYYIKG